MHKNALGDEQCVLGIVADHPAVEHQPLTPPIAEESSDPLPRDSLGRQADGIAHRRTEEHAPESIGYGERTIHVIGSVGVGRRI